MLSLWTGSEFLEPYEMELANTPCLETYQNGWGIFPADLQTQFPLAPALASLQEESYVSVVIRDFDGKILGNLGIIDTKPLGAETSVLKFTLGLFANRVAAEMERQIDEDELRQTNQRLELTNQELIHATRLKDEFLANMSHELRTPLNAILGLSESLQEGILGPVSQRQHKALGTVERSGRHLLSLINDVLDVSKISAGKLALNLQTVEISALLQSSLALIRQQAHDKRIRLEVHLPIHVGTIVADERRIRQVLINLLSNAVKFTEANGQITLEAKRQEPQSNTAGWLEFIVTDTGIGISSADRKKLFKPFMQLDSRLNRQYEGTGLGLALVKQIIELHGGSVDLESEVGQGSSFTVRLPQISRPTAPSGTATPSETSAIPYSHAETARTRTLLIAEDNEANIETFHSYLTARGYRVQLARNGRQAVEVAQRERPDLILMDIQMPEMDGTEAITCMRQHDHLRSIPIIALTALAMEGDRGLAAGATDYLTKPVKLRELNQRICHWLDQQ